MEDTKTLVGGAAGTQEQLAAAAQSAVTTIGQFSFLYVNLFYDSLNIDYFKLSGTFSYLHEPIASLVNGVAYL